MAFRNIDWKTLMKSGSAIQGTLCLIVGLFFIAAPGIATRSISMGLGLVAIYWMGNRLLCNAFSSEADLKQRKYKVIFYMAAISLISFLLTKTSLMFRFTNLLVGVFFLVFDYKQMKKFAAPHLHTGRRILHILASLALYVLGIMPLLFRGLEFTPYAGVAGICILLFGIGRIAFSMYENGKRNV